jgi:hypothetical protein
MASSSLLAMTASTSVLFEESKAQKEPEESYILLIGSSGSSDPFSNSSYDFLWLSRIFLKE